MDEQNSDHSQAPGAALPANVVGIRPSILSKPPVKGNPVEHPRWQGHATPSLFVLTDKGTIRLSDDKPGGILLCGPLLAIAMTAGIDGKNGGLRLALINKQNLYIEQTIPLTRLHEDAKLLAQDLAHLNFFIVPGKEKDILLYLATSEPTEILTACPQTGWVAGTDPEELVFVTPSWSTNPDHVYQPTRFNPGAESQSKSGTLKDWISNCYAIGPDSQPGPYPLFVILTAISATLIPFTGMDSGGFNFYGDSSSGKTTLLQLAASVFGNGCDPSNPNSYIYRLHTSRVAFERLASSRNHMPCCLDELGSLNPKDVASIVYDASGGQGKSTMTQSRDLRQQDTWCEVFLLSGEVSIQQQIESNMIGNRRIAAKAGQLVRILDNRVPSNMFQSREQVDDLKRNCSKYFGTLGPAFIEAVVSQFTVTTLRNTVQIYLDEELNRLISRQAKTTPLQQRAMRRFALTAAAGRLLVQLKLIPALDANQVHQAVDTVCDGFMRTSATLSDIDRALIALREFILRYRHSHFQPVSDTRPNVHLDTYGYHHSVRGAYFILPASFRDAIGGADPTSVARELKDRGFLLIEPADKTACLMLRVPRGTDEDRPRCYAIKESFLNSD